MLKKIKKHNYNYGMHWLWNNRRIEKKKIEKIIGWTSEIEQDKKIGQSTSIEQEDEKVGKDVKEWLASNVGDRVSDLYAQKFIDDGFDDVEAIENMTNEELEELGVKVGHRKKIMRAVERMSHEPETSQ